MSQHGVGATTGQGPSSPSGVFDYLCLALSFDSHGSGLWQWICHFLAGVRLYFGSAVSFSYVNDGCLPIGWSYSSERNPKSCNDSDQWLSLSRIHLNPWVADEIWAPSAPFSGGHRDPFICQIRRPGSSRLVVLQAVGGKIFTTNFIPLNPAEGCLHSSGAAPWGTQAGERQ